MLIYSVVSRIENRDSGSDNSDTSVVAPDTGSLGYNGSALPSGWMADILQRGHIMLSHDDNGCFIETLYNAGSAEPNAANIDHNQEALSALQAKGFTVQRQSAGKLSIKTSKGTIQIPSQIMYATIENDDNIYQTNAFISKTKAYGSIQLSCPIEADLAGAKKALLTITFKDI